MKKAVPVAKALSDVRLVSSDTPWGKAQSAEEIGPGILKYSTASHGGYFLDTIANAKVSPIFKKATFCQQGMRGWYEEDCDWAIVVYIFKEFFDSKTYKIALKTIKEHHSDALHQLQKTLK